MIAPSKMILGAGGALLEVKFSAKRPDLGKDLADLRWNGRPLNEALAGEVLHPFLTAWRWRPGDRRSEVKASVDAAMDRCVEIFRACLPRQSEREERALIAALAATANLQRTLLYLGEALLRPKRRGERRTLATLSLAGCGLAPARRREIGRVPFKSLARALGCSSSEVDARCRDALAALRDDLNAGSFLAREELRPLRRRDPASSG